jgi:hypothetical protein
MRRTTLYIPDQLKREIEAAVEREGLSEAEFMRRALARAVNDSTPPGPRIPLFRSGQPDLAENVDQALDGFGER